MIAAEALKKTDIRVVIFGANGATESISLWDPNDSWETENVGKQKQDEPSHKKGKVNDKKGKETKNMQQRQKAEGSKEKPDRFKPESVDEHKVSQSEGFLTGTAKRTTQHLTLNGNFRG